MPLYDCGDPECGECERAFGPDRSSAIARHDRRQRAYAAFQVALENGATFEVAQKAERDEAARPEPPPLVVPKLL